MNALGFSVPGNEAAAEALAAELGAEAGRAEVRQFPDGEWYVRIDSEVSGCGALVVASLDHPDSRVLAAYFVAATARDLGATRVGLVAPYLAYMRQDDRFRPGEGITSTYFSRLISGAFDWIVTVDPHLHRRASLGEIYTIPSRVVHAAPRVSAWIADNVAMPLIIGPDRESEQWVSAVATAAGAPFVVLEKTRRGDRDVEIAVPRLDTYAGRTPVLVDDIISTGRTMVETVEKLRETGMQAPVCAGIHGVFADDAYERLLAAGASRVVTTNTIPHRSNAIDVTASVAGAVSSVTVATEH